MYRRKTADIQEENVANAVETYRRVLVSADEAPHFALRRFEIKPGGEIPLHSNTVEHEQFILSGKAVVKIGDEEFTAVAREMKAHLLQLIALLLVSNNLN